MSHVDWKQEVGAGHVERRVTGGGRFMSLRAEGDLPSEMDEAVNKTDIINVKKGKKKIQGKTFDEKRWYNTKKRIKNSFIFLGRARGKGERETKDTFNSGHIPNCSGRDQ